MESGIGLGIESGLLIGVLAMALAFGIIYERLIAYLEASGRARGYTALMVIGGVFVSLALAAFLVGLQAFLLTLIVFSLTGSPVALGSFWRHTEERSREEAGKQQLLKELLDGSAISQDVLQELRAIRRQANVGGDDSA